MDELTVDGLIKHHEEWAHTHGYAANGEAAAFHTNAVELLKKQKELCGVLEQPETGVASQLLGGGADFWFALQEAAEALVLALWQSANGDWHLSGSDPEKLACDLSSAVANVAGWSPPVPALEATISREALALSQPPYSYEYIAERVDAATRWRIRDRRDDAVGHAPTEAAAREAVVRLNRTGTPESP